MNTTTNPAIAAAIEASGQEVMLDDTSQAPKSASHPTADPGAVAPKAFDAFLCRAWGETDMPAAELVSDWDGVRRFLIREWLGKEDEETLLQVKDDFEQHEEDMGTNGGPHTITFEIGGVSIERVCGFSAPSIPSASLTTPSKEPAGAVADAHTSALQLKPDEFYVEFFNSRNWNPSPRNAFRAAWFKCINELRLRGLLAAAHGTAIDAREQEATASRPPLELAWLFGHCRAIGMTCKSDSGKWEHDIALFTANLQDEIAALKRALASHPEAPPASAPAAEVAQPVAGFDREMLSDLADGLDCYEKTVNVGPAIEPGMDVLLESTTAGAARFIRAYLATGADALDELRRACAKILREDPEVWPRHGDAALGIRSAMSLLAMTVRNPPGHSRLQRASQAAYELLSKNQGINDADYRVVTELAAALASSPSSAPAESGKDDAHD